MRLDKESGMCQLQYSWLHAGTGSFLPGYSQSRQLGIRAQAVVDYREGNGPFRSTDELTRVEGIGTATYERIKALITVAD